VVAVPDFTVVAVPDFAVVDVVLGLEEQPAPSNATTATLANHRFRIQAIYNARHGYVPSVTPWTYKGERSKRIPI
jgi:hypothetical protein